MLKRASYSHSLDGGAADGVVPVRPQRSGAINTAIEKLASHWRRNGPMATAAAVAKSVARLVLSRHRYVVLRTDVRTPRSPSVWNPDERLLVLGPENVDSEMTPQLHAFLAGQDDARQAAENLDAVRKGDRLYIVFKRDEPVHSLNLFFSNSRRVTKRERKNFFFGELASVPITSKAWTAPAARGLGMFSRVLNEQFFWLGSQGYERVVAFADPDNDPSNKVAYANGSQIFRRLTNWIFLRSVVLQRVEQSADTRWRLFFLWDAAS